MIPAYQNIYWPTNSDTVPGFLPSSLATPQSFVAIVQALNAYTDLHQGYLGIYGNEYGVSFVLVVCYLYQYEISMKLLYS